MGLCALALVAATALAAVALAATSITHQDGPRYLPGSAQYQFGVCADTATGETVHTQYTSDGSPPGDPPDSGTGSRSGCTLTSDPGCTGGRYWLCAIPDARSVTLKYRFYALTADGQFTGLVTPIESFYTGSTAVTLLNFDAQPTSNRLLSLAGVALIAAALAMARVAARHLTR
jgi:hypothetical protein